MRALALAPLDDEPDEDDFDGGLTEAREEAARGEWTVLVGGQTTIGMCDRLSMSAVSASF